MLTTHEITELLVAWSEGDRGALDQLVPIVEAELRRLAKSYLSRERPDHILQTTALIQEAYLRLIDWRNARWQNRAHFFGVAAQMMRRILVDYAVEQNALKRGGGARRRAGSPRGSAASTRALRAPGLPPGRRRRRFLTADSSPCPCQRAGPSARLLGQKG